jgi:acyl-CoA thioesterase I
VSCSAGRWRLVTEPASRSLPVWRPAFGRLLLVMLLVVVQTAPAHALGGVILVLGDSLSSAYGIDMDSGWVQLLQKRLQDSQFGYRVVNASISGDTSSGGAARLPRALDKHRPEIVIVELGGNDGLRGLPLSVTRENLERIIVDSQTAGARVLLLGMRLPPNYGPAYTNAFHAIYQELADRYDAARVPFLLEGIGGVDEMMQADGIHPRAEAQPLMLDNVWPYLKPLL